MPKVSIKAAPTFKAAVKIPRPGLDPLVINFDFKHRGRKEFETFTEGLKDSGKPDPEVVMEMACGWDAEEAFGLDAVTELLDGHHRAARIVTDTYFEQQTQARAGN